MTDRIAISNLKAVANLLNKMTGSPLEYMTTQADGSRVINPGHFHIDQAYGGVRLVRTVNTSGGVSNVLSTGYVSKRDLFYLMHAFLAGLEFAQREQEQGA